MEFSFTYKRSTANRPRPEVTKGWVKIEHVATGKFVVHVGKHLSRWVNEQIDLLVNGTYPNKRFQKLFDGDEELKVTLFVRSNINQIQKEVTELKKRLKDEKLSYLLIE